MHLLLLALLACSDDKDVATPPAGEAPAAAPAPSAAPSPAVAQGPRVPSATDKRVAASHILVAYSGAVNALPNVTRTKEQARARAQEARSQVLAGVPFAEVARAVSDDATGPRGGYLGGFDDGTMVKPFEDAVKALKVGEVSEIVETPFGFHVIEREPLVEVHAAHLMVSWSGAERAPAGVSRTREQARARAEEAMAKLAGGADWADVVRQYSDGPLKEDAGDLGWFGRGQLAASLDEVAFDLDPGGSSGIVETPRGFHVLKRLE